MKYLIIALLLQHQVLWLVALIIEMGVLFPIGLVVTWVLARRQAWYVRKSRYWSRDITAWEPSWAWLWGNEENGVTGAAWYAVEHPTWNASKLAFMWSGWRNSVNNLRFLPFFGITIHPNRVKSVGNSLDPDADYAAGKTRFLWFYCWQGLYAGFWLVLFGFQLRLGWKLMPKDKAGVSATDYRSVACGTGWQIGKK